ncbi:MAG TPA: ABC transporter ATP-binding protein [Bacillales bacterium]|nr:ABC transporter ATP-binding protein [Bacillales bacterium]
MGETKTVVQCENLSKKYGKKFALDELDVSIPANRIVGILGPNGAGKSTLFRLMTGLIFPNNGKITVLGETPGWKTNRNIAYLPDRARWYPDHTVHQAFQWAEHFSPGFERARADELAEFMKLDPDMKTSGMSRGQEARLMLILCIARRVPLVILDEPFSGIDAISRERIIDGLLDHMEGTGQSILISTHEIHEVEGLFDYAVFLGDGKLKLSGETEELRRKHGSMHTILRTLDDE